MAYLALGLSVIFAAIFVFALPHLPRTRVPWLQIGYTVTFLIMSAAVIFAIVGLYYDGVHGKSRASVATLAQRLGDIVEFNLHFKDLEGMPRIFSEFKRLNGEINDAALIENGIIQIDSASARIGKSWVSDPRNFEFKFDLTRPDQSERIVNLVVTVPKDAVVDRVVRSVKNLAALFVASGLLAGLFLQVAASLQGLRASQSSSEAVKPNTSSAEDAALVTIKPIFFLAVFLDALTYSFLPTFMQDAARAAGLSVGYASMPFTAYYLCFALSLLPAGNLAERYGPKLVIMLGMLLACASVAMMALPMGIVELTAMRGLAGVGQGALMIGVQAHILAVASPQKKTQGVAIIVFGFQGGLISGMALGSLLVNHLQAPGVFKIAGAIGLAAVLYTVLRLPRVETRTKTTAGLGAAARELVSDIKHVISNAEFLKTLLCVGIPAKAILTSTITFALPLLLVQYHYRTEDIGQIIMLYGLAVMAASGFASRLVDRTSNSEQVLFWGTILSGSRPGADGTHEPGLLRQRTDGHRFDDRRHNHRRLCPRLYQRSGGDPCRSVRTGNAHRCDSGHDELPVPRARRTYRRADHHRADLPVLRAGRDSSHLDRCRCRRRWGCCSWHRTSIRQSAICHPRPRDDRHNCNSAELRRSRHRRGGDGPVADRDRGCGKPAVFLVVQVRQRD